MDTQPIPASGNTNQPQNQASAGPGPVDQAETNQSQPQAQVNQAVRRPVSRRVVAQAETEQPPPRQNQAQTQTTQDPKDRDPRESDIFPGQIKPLPEETVMEWQAPNRPFKKRNRQFYTTVAIITILISLILFFAGQLLPIAVVIAVAFLAYVISSVPPENVINKITTYGIRSDDQIFYWDELGRFWFEDKMGIRTLQIETIRFPNRIVLLLGNKTEQELTQLLSEVLLQEKPPDTFYEKAADWLQKKVPLETS